MRRPDAQCQPPTATGVHRQCLAGKGDRVLRLQRHHRGAEFDARAVRTPSAPPWSARRSRWAPAASTRCPARPPRPTRCRRPAWTPCGPYRRARRRSSHRSRMYSLRPPVDQPYRSARGRRSPESPAGCRSGTPRPHRRRAASAHRPAGWCRRPRRRYRRRRPPAARRRRGWSVRRARRRESKDPPVQRPPAARSTRCPRCAAGYRCR